MAERIIQFIRLLLSSPGMTCEQMLSSTGLAEGLVDPVIKRLIDSNILTEDESGLVSMAPQETPGQVKVIQLLADRGWDGAINALVEEYLEVELKRTGKPLFRVKYLKKSVRERISLLEAWELRPRLNAVIECLKNDGVVEQWDGDIHRINCPLPEH